MPGGEDFDGPIIQDILPVGRDHLTFNDDGNAIPEEPVGAHDIIPTEDNDVIDNEYDAMRPHINIDVPANVPMPQQIPPIITTLIHEEERNVASIKTVEDVGTIEE